MATTRHLKHYLRLGIHAEQRFFEENQDKYDIVVLNASLACYFASATATLMAGKLANKKFIIDPMTHAFAHNPRYIMTEEGGRERPHVKSSIAGLADVYGPPVSTAVGDGTKPRPLDRKDFGSAKAISSLAEKVVGFQEGFLANAMPAEDRKYLPDDFPMLLKPLYLIAPYFYMESGTIDKWLGLNLDLAEAAKKVAPNGEVYAEIVIDRGILDSQPEIDRITGAYVGLDRCDGFLIWISDLDEHEAGLSTLAGLKRLVASLSKTGKPVINLFGGYYSLLLTVSAGLTGVCHGPGYGEERDVVPVGGGLPVSKYYLTPVHRRLLYSQVELLVNTPVWSSAGQFHGEVCSGETCKSVLHGDLSNFYKFGEETVTQKGRRTYSFPTTDARYLTTQHYLEAKAQEFSFVSSASHSDVLGQLREARDRYQAFMTGAQLRYLDTWTEALKS